MQFDKKITVVYTNTNDFSEPVEDDAKDIKCKILEQVKRTTKDEQGKSKKYDLKIIVGNKAFAPYTDLFTEDGLIFRYDGKTYEPLMITAINGFSGKVKFYEIELKAVPNGH